MRATDGQDSVRYDVVVVGGGGAEAGVRAGVAINADLVAEDTHHAVAAHRAQRKAQATEGH